MNLVAGGRITRSLRGGTGRFAQARDLEEIVRQAKALCALKGHTGLYNAEA